MSGATPDKAAFDGPQPVTEGEVAKSAATALLARFGAIIEIVSQPAYTWLFSVATYGVYTVLWSVVNILANICDLAMTTVLQRVVPQARSDDEALIAVKAALLLTQATTVPLAILGSFMAPYLARLVNAAPRDEPTLALAIGLFCWALPLWTFLEVSGSALRARRAFGPEIRLKVFYEQASRLTAALLCFAIGMRSLGLVAAHLASLLLICAMSVRLLGRYYDLRRMIRVPIPRRTWADLVGLGSAALPANLLNRIYSDLPPVLLNIMLPGVQGATASALYGIARKVASTMQMVKLSFGYVMAPLASAQSAAVDTAAIQPLYGFATRLAAAGILPLTAGLICVGEEILFLFAPEARAAFGLLVVLTIGRSLEALVGPGGAILLVIGKRRLTLLNSAIGVLSWIPLALVLTPRLGAMGMAISVAISINLVAILALIQLYQAHRLHPFRPPFGRTVLVGLGSTLLIFAADTAGQMKSAPVGALAAFATFFVAFWISLRFGLGPGDRGSLGRFGRWLRLKV
ncbi:lipopolysaccharide biosynthesis protein [Parapedomonas caeni]|jgi:O-antigen/teichoic acid export membrane protein